MSDRRHGEPQSHIGLGLDVDFHTILSGEGSNRSQEQILNEEDHHILERTPRANSFSTALSNSRRRSGAIDDIIRSQAPLFASINERDEREDTEAGPGLDRALEYVSHGPLDNPTSQEDIQARRRGRAIYINDLLQFDGKKQASAFYTALHDWQGGCKESEIQGEAEGPPDIAVLFARARSLALSTSKGSNLDKSEGSFRRSSVRDRHALLTDMWQSPHRLGVNGMRTSASTPEGALGRLTLSQSPDEPARNSEDDNNVAMLRVDGSSPPHDHLDKVHDSLDTFRENEVLRAGLRFLIGCYDDLVRVKERRGSIDSSTGGYRDGLVRESSVVRAGRHNTESNEGMSAAAKPLQGRSRSRSVMQSLAKKGANLTVDRKRLSSLLSPQPGAAMQSYEAKNLGQVAGPSNRFGSAELPFLLSPSAPSMPDESRSPVSPALAINNGKGKRERLSSLLSSSSPGRQSRISSLDASDESKRCKSLQGDSSTHLDEVDEQLRQERVKSAALEKELAALKATFSSRSLDESGQVKDAQTTSENQGEGMGEEEKMMALITVAARDTAEAEEREAAWRSQCEELQERIEMVETALVQAISLLAEKDGSIGDKASLNGEADEQESEKAASLHDFSSPATSSPVSMRSNKSLDGSSPFYSAGEEDDDEDDGSDAVPRAMPVPSFALHPDNSKKVIEKYNDISHSMADRDKVESHTDEEEDGDLSDAVKAGKVPGYVHDNSKLYRSDMNGKATHPDEISTTRMEDDEVDPLEPLPKIFASSIAAPHGQDDEMKGKVLRTKDLSSPRSSVSGTAASRRSSHASWTRHSILPPQQPAPTSPLPTLPDAHVEEVDGPLKPNASPATYSAPPSDQSQSTDPSVPATLSSGLSDSGSSPNLRRRMSQETSRSSLSFGGLIDYSARRKTFTPSQGMPSLSIAGSLATSSPSNIFTFDDWPSTSRTSQTSASPPPSVGPHSPPSSTRKERGTNSVRSMAMTMDSPDPTQDYMGRPPSVASSERSMQARSTGKKSTARGPTKGSILGHMPSSPTQTRSTALPSKPSLSMLGEEGRSLSRSSSISLSNSSLQASEAPHRSALEEHYHQHLSKPVERGPAAHFARRTRFGRGEKVS